MNNLIIIQITGNYLLLCHYYKNKFLLFYNVYKIKSFMYKNVPGDYCKGVTPDPIPNSAVKPFSANGTLS